MPTWRERFGELSAENGRQVEKWTAGDPSQNQLRDSMDAISEFLRQWQAAGEPDRDTEM